MAPILKGISVSHQEKRERNSVTTLLYFRFNLGMDFTPNSFRSRHSLLTQDLKVLLLEYMDLWKVKVFERTTGVYERSCRGVTAELACDHALSPYLCNLFSDQRSK